MALGNHPVNAQLGMAEWNERCFSDEFRLALNITNQ
jgi:hypothetical protein